MACPDYLGMRDSPDRANERETPKISPMSVKVNMRTDRPTQAQIGLDRAIPR
jgi:hypothetical protein